MDGSWVGKLLLSVPETRGALWKSLNKREFQNHDPVRSWLEHAGAARQWPHAPSTMREAAGGCTSPRLACPKEASTSVCTHPLTHPGQRGGSLIIQNWTRHLPRWKGNAGRFNGGERRRTSTAAARVRVYWFPSQLGQRQHGLHLPLHRPPWACEAAGCDANGTGWFANDISSSIGVVATGPAPIQQISLSKYQSDGERRGNNRGRAVRSTGMRLHNSVNLIKCKLWSSEMIICRRLADYRGGLCRERQTFTFGHKRNQPERPSGERSGLAMVDVWWPERGRMHEAGGKNTEQPERDLGPHSHTIKDSHEYYCALLPKSPPTIYKRLAGTHTKKYRGEMVAAVTAAATLLCAKRRHGHCAAPDFPSSPQTARFLPNTYFSSNSASPHLACREPERRTVAILMARFHRPHYHRKSPFTRL